MNPFERVEIGGTGVRVTRLGVGGAPVGGHQSADPLYTVASYEDGVAVTRRAYELGIRYFDTAPFYGIGRSEVRFGAALGGLPRRNFVISTKVGRVLDLQDEHDLALIGPDGLPSLLPRFDLSRDGIMRSHRESLRRLVTDYVDILFLHNTSAGEMEEAAVETALPTLVELRRRGSVRAIGVGTADMHVLHRYVEEFPLDVVLLPNHYTLLTHTALESFLPLCESRGVAVVIGTPFNSGILASDLSGPALFNYQRADAGLMERARMLKDVCDRHGVDLKAAALQFVLAHPAVVSTIPGPANVSQLEENATLAAVDIPPELWHEMREKSLIPREAPTPVS